MGRGGGLRCPTCGSYRTKSAPAPRVRRYRSHRLADGGVLRGHECQDCGKRFLSVQRHLDHESAEQVESEMAG